MLLVCSAVVVEASLQLLYAILKQQMFPFRSYEDGMHRISTLPEFAEADGQLEAGEIRWEDKSLIEVIHPYLGFVRDPRKTTNTSYLGFPQKNDDPLVRKNRNTVTVAVFGGSFAQGISESGESVMESTLRDHGINARILTVAMGGYKQPQQLLALAYLLSHGAQIDVVVNIDGFNEVALPEAENIPMGVNPFYPRAWYTRTLRLLDQVTLRRIGHVSVLQDNRRRWAMILSDMPKFSIIRNLVWRAYDTLLERRIVDIVDQIRRSQPQTAKRFLTAGPDLGINEETALYQEIADHWKSCSLLMKAMCDSQGIAYIHILQPNQYFEAGRILTEIEKENAFQEDSPYRPGVVKGYPSLLAVKNDLIDGGVNFHDLTTIYYDNPQPIYQDACCHPNRLGYEIVAEHVAQTIVEVIGIGGRAEPTRKAQKTQGAGLHS
jgi:hypothetical protein